MVLNAYPAIREVASRVQPKPPAVSFTPIVQGFKTVGRYVVKHPVQVGIIAAGVAVSAASFGLLAPEAAAVDAAALGGDAAAAAAESTAASDVAVNTTSLGVSNIAAVEGAAGEEAAAEGEAAGAAARTTTLRSAFTGIGKVAGEVWRVGKPALYGLSIGTGAALAGRGIESALVSTGGGIQYLITGQPPSYAVGLPPFVPTPSGPGPGATQPTQTPTGSFFTSPLFGILVLGGLVVVALIASRR